MGIKISVVKKGEVYRYRVSRRETEGTELMKTRLGVFKRFVIIPLTSKKVEKFTIMRLRLWLMVLKARFY